MTFDTDLLSRDEQIAQLTPLLDVARERSWDAALFFRTGDVVAFALREAPYLEIVNPLRDGKFDLWDQRIPRMLVVGAPLPAVIAGLEAVLTEVARMKATRSHESTPA